MRKACFRNILAVLILVVLVRIFDASPASAVGNYPDAPFCIPTTGTVTTLFSSWHPAIDIARGSGKGPAVYAPYAGEIIYVGWSLGENHRPDIYPRHLIIINHGLVNGQYTASMFAHLGANGDPSRGISPVSYIPQDILNGSRRSVSMGTLIGYQGAAGYTTGTHTHFAVRIKTSSTPFTSYYSFWTTGGFVNPKEFIVGGAALPLRSYLESNCVACAFAPGQGSSRQHLFQEAYDRNGGREKLGCPLWPIRNWWGLERQDFGGTVLYKPSILLDPSAHGPAYVVHGEIGQYYLNHFEGIGPYHDLGSPVSDEYTNAFGARQSDFRDGFIYWTGPGTVRAREYILREGSRPEHYFVERGIKRWIPNSPTLAAMDAGPVQIISRGELNSTFRVNGSSVPDVNNVWLAQYFDNYDWRRPAKALKAVSTSNLNFNWGLGPPDPLIPNDFFSAKFSRRFYFKGGPYEFSTTVDDDIGVYLDGKRIGGQGLGAGRFTYTIDEGWHLLQVRYREYCAPAYLSFSFKRLDTTPPAASVFLSPAKPDGDNGWYRGPVTVTLSASDDDSGVSKIEYDLGSGWVTYFSPFTVSWEGAVNLSYRAIDEAGNVEVAKETTLKIDETAPSSSLEIFGPYHNSLPISIPVVANDSLELKRVRLYKRSCGSFEWGYHSYVSVEGGEIQFSGFFNVATLSEGEWEFASRAVDVAGNVEELPVEADITLIFDSTAPTTELSFNGSSYEAEDGELFVSPETKFELSADDANPTDPLIETSGVAETDYNYIHTILYEDKGGVYEEPFSLEGEDGTYVVNYNSTDVAGNVETENSQEVYLDSTPPVSSDDSDGEWHDENVSVLIVSDDGDGSGVKAIYYSSDDQEEMAEGDQVLVVFEEEGTHELSYYAVDNVENVEGEKHAALVKIDKTPPEIVGAPMIESNGNGWYSEDVIVHFDAEDQPGLSGLKSVTLDVVISAEGEDQEVIGTAEDNAGNTASYPVGDINIDKTNPDSEITFPEDGEYYNAESWEDEIRGTASDNLSGVESVEVEVVGVEKGEAQLEVGWEYSLDFAEDGSDDGKYTVRSRAIDLAENQESTDEVNFTYDSTPPVTSVDLQGLTGLNGWYVSPVTLRLSVFDGTSGVGQTCVSVTKDGKPYYYTLEYNVAEPLVFGDGEYIVEFWSIDLAGNEESHQIISFKIDTVAPEAPTPSVLGGNFTEGETVTVTLSGEDGADIFYSINDVVFVSYEAALDITEDTVFATYAVDAAGNCSAIVEFTFVFKSQPSASPDAGESTPQILGARATTEAPPDPSGGETLATRSESSGGWELPLRVQEDQPQVDNNSTASNFPLITVIGVIYLLFRGMEVLRRLRG